MAFYKPTYLAPVGEGDVLVVQTGDDGFVDDGVLTFREALTLAEASPGTQEIRFAPGVSTVQLDNLWETQGLEVPFYADINSDVTINGDTDGDGQADVTINGLGNGNVLTIQEGVTASLESLIITGGAPINQAGLPDVPENDGVADGSGDASRYSGGFGGDGAGAFYYGQNVGGDGGFGGKGGDSGYNGLAGDGGWGGDGGDGVDNFSNPGNGGFGGDGGLNIGGGLFPGFEGRPSLGGDAAGAIWNKGTLTLSRVEIYGNSAEGGDNGDHPYLYTAIGEFDGGQAAGGILNDGDLSVSDSAFSTTSGSTGEMTGNTGLGGWGTVESIESVYSPPAPEQGEPNGYYSDQRVSTDVRASGVDGIINGRGPSFGELGATQTFETPVVTVAGDLASFADLNDTSSLPELTTNLTYLYAGDLAIAEGETLTFHVNRLGDLSGTQQVDWSISGDGDFDVMSGTLTLASGVQSDSVTVTALNDMTAEGSETVVLEIASADATLGTSSASVVIEDRVPGLDGIVDGTSDADIIVTNYVDAFGDVLTDGKTAHRVFAYEGDDVVAIAKGRGIEVSGGAGDDVIRLTSATGTVTGDEGNDTIFTGVRSMIVDGGSGADRLVANMGYGARHILTGGEGADTFEFTAASATNMNVATVTDFDLALDTLIIEGTVVDLTNPGSGFGVETTTDGHFVLSYGDNDEIIFNDLGGGDLLVV
ncbi:calcium-binding protein [Palleronia caenipelagi]|uniref:Calcium-binding protein n=1 Tax=Palleronia caenipelagi TaxID=2489174 RepID=A0A547PJT2_9RHOB|nr:hypothetical protein [Palleronia caenipelagi]TRD14380.1 hypothetical protein FEV53_19050 [Palleronia caenipelagi]